MFDYRLQSTKKTPPSDFTIILVSLLTSFWALGEQHMRKEAKLSPQLNKCQGIYSVILKAERCYECLGEANSCLRGEALAFSCMIYT